MFSIKPTDITDIDLKRAGEAQIKKLKWYIDKGWTKEQLYSIFLRNL